jgi:hypothetical protein
MIDIPAIPPANPRINKTQVSNKDPHHEREKQKQHDGQKKVEDEITLESIAPAEKKEEPQKKPPTPLSGHVDIEA